MPSRRPTGFINKKSDVDPFGSASFGFATLRGQSSKTRIPVFFLCVYDKHEQTAWLAQYDRAFKPAADDIERCGAMRKAARGTQSFGPFMRKCLQAR